MFFSKNCDKLILSYSICDNE